MAATSYEYDVIDDFSSGVDSAALQYQVEQSAISSAAVTHIGTSWKGGPPRDKCDVWFDDPLSPGDETILDSVVAAHDGEPLDCLAGEPGCGPIAGEGTPPGTVIALGPLRLRSGVFYGQPLGRSRLDLFYIR